MSQDPRIEAAAKAARIAWSGHDDWDGAPNSVRIAYRGLATAALAAADKAAVLVASHQVRQDWANYIETWEGTVGGPVCNPQNIVAALRAKGTPFGASSNDRGTE